MEISARKEHYKRLLNQIFEWDSESLHFEEPVFGPPPQISLGSVKKALLEIKKVKRLVILVLSPKCSQLATLV